jgi:hypothetical protein
MAVVCVANASEESAASIFGTDEEASCRKKLLYVGKSRTELGS